MCQHEFVRRGAFVNFIYSSKAAQTSKCVFFKHFFWGEGALAFIWIGHLIEIDRK